MKLLRVAMQLLALISLASPVAAEMNPKFGALNPVDNAPKPKAKDMSLAMPNGLKGDADKGRDFYMQNCYTCHGVTGAGDGPRAYFINPMPRDFLLDVSRSYLNRPTLFDAITKGRPGTEMPAWGKVLTEQEVANVAEYVFQTFIMAGKKGTGHGSK